MVYYQKAAILDRIKIAIIGAGGLGRDLRSLLLGSGPYEFAGFWDDNTGSHPEVKGNIQALKDQVAQQHVLIAVGNPQIRKKLYEELSKLNHLSFPTIVHEQAFLGDKSTIQLGEGTVVFPGAVLTTDIKIGENVIIHAGCSLHHDTRIGAHSVIMPGVRISGGAQLGDESFVGSGICLPDQRTYSEKTTIKSPMH